MAGFDGSANGNNLDRQTANALIRVIDILKSSDTDAACVDAHTHLVLSNADSRRLDDMREELVYMVEDETN